MEYGQIIKKAWAIAWRYRFLWVLAIFAGITGPGSGGFNFPSGNSWRSGSGSSTSSLPWHGTSQAGIEAAARQWVPAIAALGLLWIAVGIFIIVISTAARGGLIWAVNELEDGRRPTLGSAWRIGFSRFWSLLGAGILLALPILAVVALLAFFIAVPVVTAIASGGGRAAALAAVPICGSLVIAVPLLIVLSFALGITGVIAQRRIVLDGEGAWQSVKDGWRTLRARFKDTALMWLINWGLNIAATIVLAIPIVIVTIAFFFPGLAAGMARNWGALAGVVGLYVLVVVAISIFYTAVWGTFTSSMWTILYRRLTGREQVIPTPPRVPMPYPPAPPVSPSYPGGPVPPAGYQAPPAAGWAQPAPQPPAQYPPAPPMAPYPPQPPMAAPQPPEQPQPQPPEQPQPQPPEQAQPQPPEQPPHE